MTHDFDVCVIGSGAGGSPVALTLAQAGYEVLVLEKGQWLTESDLELSMWNLTILTEGVFLSPLANPIQKQLIQMK